MPGIEELLEFGWPFHGHRCPGMPLGARAALAAMNALGVERAKHNELHVISETGKGHAAGCFLDGVMIATGCTYGKSNIEKLYYNKMAFTLIDIPGQKSVRVSIKPEFFAKMLQSPFAQERKKGVAPQDISSELADPMIGKVLTMPEDVFLDIGEVTPCEFITRKAPIFDIAPCSQCGEMVFVNKLVDTAAGRICQGCRNAKA